MDGQLRLFARSRAHGTRTRATGVLVAVAVCGAASLGGLVVASPASASPVPSVEFDSPAENAELNTHLVTITFHVANAVHDELYTFTCSIDDGPAPDCVSPFTTDTLPDGQHHVTVTAIAGGHSDPLSATRTFIVDTAPPVVTIDSLQPGDVNGHDGTIAFHSDDDSAAYTCAIDEDSPIACSSPFPYAHLANGPHSFHVVATDPAGNQGEASRIFSVDVSVPVFTNDSLTSVGVKAPFLFLITTDGSPAALIHAQYLPKWLSLTDNGDGTATLRGTPPRATTMNVDLVAANGHGPKAQQRLTIVVFNTPKFLSGAHSLAAPGNPWEASITTKAVPSATLSSADLPAWLTLRNSGHGHGEATLAGTPPTTGRFTFTLTATNIGGSTDQLFTLVVKNGIGGRSARY